MNRIKRSLIVAVVLGFLGTAAIAAEIMVSGIGQGSGSDQSLADVRAQQQATAAVNASCPGYTENVETTSDSCFNAGDDDNPKYICMVTAKAICHIGR
jgi:hypothetical protein